MHAKYTGICAMGFDLGNCFFIRSLSGDLGPFFFNTKLRMKFVKDFTQNFAPKFNQNEFLNLTKLN